MRMRRDATSRSFRQRERSVHSVLKAYRKLVGDFPHDPSSNSLSEVGETMKTIFDRIPSSRFPSTSRRPSRNSDIEIYPLLFSLRLPPLRRAFYRASSIRKRVQLCASELVGRSGSTPASWTYRWARVSLYIYILVEQTRKQLSIMKEF